MQYAIIGAGGTGGVVGYFMTKAGKDVTLIARGRHLEAMKEHGLTLERLWDPNPETIAVKATDMEHYKEQPDVILVCVKGYSLEDTVPFIRRVAKPDTIVIPILNIYGTGAKLQKELPELLVTDGCIYVSANIKEPGVLVQHGKILRIVYGVREKADWRPELEEIRQDFADSAIDGILSENIRREALEKFSYVSPIGAAGLYCNAVAGDFQKEGAPRELFCSMIREIAALADGMGVPFQKDMVDVNLHILSTLAPETTTSMQRDVMAGKPSEIDGLVYEVVRMGKLYGVPVPSYTKVANRLAEKKGIIFDMDGVLVNTEPLHYKCWNHLAVASSLPTESIEMNLKTIGIRQYFDSITSGLEVKYSKPAPDIFLCAMEKLHLTASECLVIEDSTNGGKAARAAGMKCVWYHNPDSGDQNIPQAEFEIEEWNTANVEKIIQIME